MVHNDREFDLALSDMMQDSIRTELAPEGLLDLDSLVKKHEHEVAVLGDYKAQLLDNKNAVEKALILIDKRIASVEASISVLSTSTISEVAAKAAAKKTTNKE